jgi:small-conductance mechanosensitive channel
MIKTPVRVCLFLIGMLLFWPSHSASDQNPSALREEKVQSNAPKEREKEAGALLRTFPGLSGVVPAAGKLAEDAADAQRIISARVASVAWNTHIGEAEADLHRLRTRISKMGDPGSWDLQRLSETKAALLNEKKTLEVLTENFISSSLKELESIHKEWAKQRKYWESWRDYLSAKGVEPPKETFDQAQETIRKVLESVANAETLLVPIQNRTSALLQELIRYSKVIEEAQIKLHQETFKRTGPSFLSREFLTELVSSVSAPHGAILEGLSKGEDAFVSLDWGAILLRIVIILAVAGMMLSLRPSAGEVGDWVLLLRHPWALGVFLSEVLAFFSMREPIGLSRYLTNSLFALSCTILAYGTLDIRPARSIVLFLAVLPAFLGLLKAISPPPAVYRLVFALITTMGTMLLLRWALDKTRRVRPEKWILTGVLWVGTFVLAVATLAQVTGFVNLAERLIFLPSAITFLFIGLIVMFHISDVAVEMVLGFAPIAASSLVGRFGRELSRRIKVLARIAIFSLALISLFRILGIYGSTGQAFERVFSHHVQIGDLRLSVALLLGAALVRYLFSTMSWIIQAILTAEVFPNKDADIGAEQSIAKLVHYFLMFLGVLVAMSITGIDLTSLAVFGGGLGVAVGFGTQNIINNFVSGLILLFERPIKVGDRVQVGDEEGTVTRIGLRSTIIEIVDDWDLIVPNSQFVSQKVNNYTLKETVFRLRIPVRVAFNSDVDLALRTLKEAASVNIHVLKQPPPRPVLVRFGEIGLEFELDVWLVNVNMKRQVRSEIIMQISRCFREAGIRFAVPREDVLLQVAGSTGEMEVGSRVIPTSGREPGTQ